MYQNTPDTFSLEAELPGEHEVDDALVAHAVAQINRISRLKGLDGILLLGEYVLSALFEQDTEQFKARARTHKTFRAVLAQASLQPTASTIWYAVAIVEQCAMLPTHLAAALPPSHHRILLPIRNATSKARLAKLALDGNLTKREFEVLIRKSQVRLPRRSRGGRKTLPAVVKGLPRISDALDIALSEPIDHRTLARFTLGEARALLANANAQRERVTLLAEQLAAQVGRKERAQKRKKAEDQAQAAK